jgi:hypothetical protein
MFKSLCVLALLLALTGALERLHAMPPFNDESALNWLRDTVHSEVPIGDRIYILGPDKTKEYYGLNGGIATHDLETRIVVAAHDYKRLADLLTDLPYKDRAIDVLVWRAGHQKNHVELPVYRENFGTALNAPFVLHADDIVELKPVQADITVTI